MTDEAKTILADTVRCAFDWLFNGRTGSSSKAILGHMLCGVSDGSHPYDPADLSRCLIMLEMFPEWEARMPEMAAYSEAWRHLASEWPALKSTMADEVGIDWTKGKSAPKTYAMMKEIRSRAGAMA